MLRNLCIVAFASAAAAFCPTASVCHSRIAQSKVAAPVMSAVVDEVMDKLKSMTLLEASELVKAIEETFDVDASAGGGGGMMMMAPGAAVGGAEAAGGSDEKTEFDLVLDSFPADKKIAVLKVVRGITGLGLKEAKEFVEGVPKALKEGASKEDCEAAKKEIEEAGGVCSMK